MMRLKKEDIDKPISQADLDAAYQRCKKTVDDVEVQRYGVDLMMNTVFIWYCDRFNIHLCTVHFVPQVRQKV